MSRMWIAQIIKSDGSIINEYLLRGKEIKIGREMGVDYLPTIYNNNIDKTLSRDHARIVINDDILSIVDNNSKFGTFTDNKPNSKITENYQIKSGQIIKFGQANTRIRFIKCPYVFCTSQYYKDEKEKIKRAAKILGSRVSSNVDDASHLVCPKYSATTKILTAIVMEKKIVSINWLSFIEENSKFSLIPSCNEYAPTIHEMMGSYQETAHLSRSSLLKNYTIFITTKTDTQYASIFKSCGSNLIDLSHIEDPVLLKGTIKNTDLSNNNKAACIFYDTANYKTGLQSAPLLDSSFLNENESIGDENIPILWLSAENLARAVIKNEEPLLVKYITTSGKSQISSQKSMTYQYNFDSLNQNNNASPLPPNSPTANAKLNIVIPSIVQQTSLKLTHTKEQTIDVSKPIVPIFVSDSQKLKVPASQPETMNDTHNEEEIVVQQQKQRSSHKRERNLDEFDENIENKISKRRESTKKSHNDDEIFQESNNDVRVTNHNNIIEEVDDEIKDPLMELQALQEYEDMNVSHIITLIHYIILSNLYLIRKVMLIMMVGSLLLL